MSKIRKRKKNGSWVLLPRKGFRNLKLVSVLLAPLPRCFDVLTGLRALVLEADKLVGKNVT